MASTENPIIKDKCEHKEEKVGGTLEPEVRQSENPISPAGSLEGVSSNEEDDVVEKNGRKPGASSDQEELIPIPPSVPKNGMTILSHKLWIGNLDKRLTE